MGFKIKEIRNYNNQIANGFNLCVFFTVVFIFYKSIANQKLIVGIMINLILLIFSVYIYILSKKSNFILIDIRFLMILGYIIYSIYTPICFCLDKSNFILYPKIDGQLQTVAYVFNEKDLIKPLIISILFLFGFFISIFLTKKHSVRILIDKCDFFNTNIYIVKFFFWFFLFIISFLWYAYPYIKLGFNTMSYGRWYRYNVLFKEVRNQSGLINSILRIFTNTYLVLISLFQMYVCSLKSDKKSIKIIYSILFFVWSMFMLFIDVRRRELLMVIFMIVCYYISSKIKVYDFKLMKKKLMTIVFIIIILASSFMIYQYYKDYFDYAYKNGIIRMMQFRENQGINSINKYANEFGLVYLVNLSGTKYSNHYIYGKSYFEAFFRMVPGLNKMLWTCFNYDKYNNSLAEIISNIFPNVFNSGGGLGFTPSFEAYINFGYLGCLIIGMIMGILFNILQKAFCNKKNIIYYCIVFSLAFGFSRTSLLGFNQELFWLSINFIFYEFIFKILILKNLRQTYTKEFACS